MNLRVAAFISSLGLPDLPGGSSIGTWVDGLSETALHDMGLDREQLAAHLNLLAEAAAPAQPRQAIHTLTISGGSGKDGQTESDALVVKAGEIVCIVGPTGSGKSRLLADVECLAQGDTPSGRHILLNDAVPTPDQRFAPDCKLVAQLSQNMNFVVDLTVGAFLDMHAACRQIDPRTDVTGRIIAIANSLAGERFSPDVSLTQLSGGQARALMIADAALLSESPIVLIDEIENAGINRRHALDLLVAEDKIVLISTHDPLLALLGDRRVIIRNGRVADVITTSEAEKSVLVQLESIDAAMLALRERLRRGDRIEDPIDWGPGVEQQNPVNRLEILLQRHSVGALAAPAPEGEALQLIIQAALRVPDHQRLHPYAFIIAKDDGLQRLGAIMQRAAIAAGKPDDVVQRSIRMPARAPMVVVVVATPRPHDLVPVFDQQLAAGCAVMAMQMAAQALGFGGIWRSGWFMYDRLLHQQLGLREQDQIVGFLYLGTPKVVPAPPPAIDGDSFVRWL